MCAAKKLGDQQEQVVSTQARQILENLGKQIMILQSDSANIVGVIIAFHEIQKSWEGNIILTTDMRTDLNVYFLKRWKMFSEKSMGFLVHFFIEFLQLTPEAVEFLLHNGENDVSKLGKTNYDSTIRQCKYCWCDYCVS